MKVITSGGDQIDLGTLETNPTISIVDYSRRVTDDFGVTTVVKRDFSRKLSLRFSLATSDVDATQRELADLRATSAQWVADDRFEWLNVIGFYKDFELDFQTETLTYCTLTIESLAESEAGTDNGSDPAPLGTVSTMHLLQPMDVTDAALVSSNVPEADYPVWNGTTGYAAGTRVISMATHRIYESTVNVSFGQDPTTTTGSWVDVGPTNRWAMFDQALGTLTSNAGVITVVLNAALVNAVALLDVTAATVRVQTATYDRTMAVVEGAVSFLDLPMTNGHVTVTIAGTGTLSVGTLLLGRLVALGITEATPTAGINDYSKKDTDDFGVTTVVPRSWAKKMGVRALLDTNAIDVVANRIAGVRAVPSLWIADAGTESLTIYGFFKDFSIDVGEEVSTLTLSIEGLSEAAPMSGALSDLVDSLLPKVQWSSDGLGGTGASAWHATYVDGQDYFMRQSDDNGTTWGPAMRAVGVSSAQVLLYKRSATIPPRPTTASTYTFASGALTGQDNGWTQSPPANDGNPLYVISATAGGGGASVNIPANAWSVPVVFVLNGRDGGNGSNGLSTAQVLIYQRADTAPPTPSAATNFTFATSILTGLNNGWSQTVPASNGKPLWVTAASASSAATTDTIQPNEWAGPVIMAQDGSGGTGSNGLNTATVYLYQRSVAAPAVPSADTNYTFATGVLSGITNGWSQTIPAVVAGQSLWITQATALGSGSTDSVTPTEWATPQILAQNGSDGSNGLSTAQILLYQRADTAPATPSAVVTYTFASHTVAGVNNGWSPSVPASNGHPLWVTAASASSAGPSDTITPAEWATPVIMAQDGSGGSSSNGINAATVYLYQRAAAGPAVPDTVSHYTFATGVLSGSDNGWSQAIPSSNGQPLWVTLATALGSGATDDINPAEWAAPSILAQDGTDGAPGTALIAPPVNIYCNSSGTPKTGEIPKTVQCHFTVGGPEITAAATWSAPTSMVGCSATSAGGGAYNITDITQDSASFVVTGSYNGVTLSLKIPVGKVYDGAAAQTSSANITSQPTGSWAPAGAVLSLNVYPGTTITMSFGCSYSMNNPGAGQVWSRLMYQNVTDGGAWTEAGSEIHGTDATWTGTTEEPDKTGGSVSGSAVVPAPSSQKVYDFRVDWAETNSVTVAGSTAKMQVAIT